MGVRTVPPCDTSSGPAQPENCVGPLRFLAPVSVGVRSWGSLLARGRCELATGTRSLNGSNVWFQSQGHGGAVRFAASAARSPGKEGVHH